MRLALGLTALASFLAPAPFLIAQTSPSRLNATPFPTGYAPGFTLAPATGALVWNLPIGEVPGPIPIPVVFRFQASMNADLARPAAGAQGLSGGPAPSVLRYRGIWSSLHFGFIAPPQDLGQGLAEEGTQILEDGTILRDRNWTRRAEDGSTLPLAFGFNAPPEGYATDGSGTYGLFSATLDGLGALKAQVAHLTSSNAFQVLLDADRARIYAYHDTLKTFVPVLWVDRQGNWASFTWQENDSFAGESCSVRAINPEGKGVQVSWPHHEKGAGEVELLRAEFIGLSQPSLCVRGYAGLPALPPVSLQVPAGMSTLPVPLAAGGPLGRPTRLLWAPPDGLPITLPEEWNFAYSDSSLTELKELRDPRGATTTFAFATFAFPGEGPILRGLSEALTVDPTTGASRTHTWSRQMPRAAGEAWSVNHHEISAKTDGSEERTILFTFKDVLRGTWTSGDENFPEAKIGSAINRGQISSFHMRSTPMGGPTPVKQSLPTGHFILNQKGDNGVDLGSPRGADVLEATVEVNDRMPGPIGPLPGSWDPGIGNQGHTSGGVASPDAQPQTNKSWKDLARNYLNEANGDCQKAWINAYNDRFGHANDGPYRQAEHFLYAYMTVKNNPLQFPTMAAAIAGWSTFKYINASMGSPFGEHSKSSVEEMAAGYQGAIAGYTDSKIGDFHGDHPRWNPYSGGL